MKRVYLCKKNSGRKLTAEGKRGRGPTEMVKMKIRGIRGFMCASVENIGRTLIKF